MTQTELDELQKMPVSDVLANITTYSGATRSEAQQQIFKQMMVIAHEKIRTLIMGEFDKREAPNQFIDFDHAVQLNPKGVDTLLLDICNNVKLSQEKEVDQQVIVGDAPIMGEGWFGTSNANSDYLTVVMPKKTGSNMRRGFIVEMMYENSGAKKITTSQRNRPQESQLLQLQQLQHNLSGNKALNLGVNPIGLNLKFFALSADKFN